MKKMLLFFVIYLFTFSNLFGQGIPYGREFQINTTIHDNQYNPSATCLNNGNFIVCWRGQDSDGYGIYGQQFNSSCNKIGAEFRINSIEYMDQMLPCVNKLNNGGFVVCWTTSDPGVPKDIYGQIFTEQATLSGFPLSINNYKVYNQTCPSICSLNPNGFFVCWHGCGPDQTLSGNEIFAQYFDNTGNKINNEFIVNTNHEHDQTYPKATSLSNSDIVICWWEDYEHIYGQIISNKGIKRGNEFVINNTGKPSVVALDDGRFLVCWQRRYYRHVKPYGIFAQIFDSLGNKIGNEIQVKVYNDKEIQENLTVSRFSDSKIIICWELYSLNTVKADIYAQIINIEGQKFGSEFQVNTFSEKDQVTPSTVSMPDGGVIVCWSSYGQDGSEYGIFGKYLKEINHELIAFNLLEPNNDSYLQTNRIKLLWEQPSRKTKLFPWELTFDLYIDTDYNFSNRQIIKDIQDTTYNIDSLEPGKTYFWKVLAKNLAGDSLWSTQQDWGFYISHNATSVETAEKNFPTGFELYQNYPNPFNSSTEIRYSIQQASSSQHVRIRIYDIRGRLVNVLVDKKQFSGIHVVSWDGEDINGDGVSSGIYFCALQVENFKTIKKMLLLQ